MNTVKDPVCHMDVDPEKTPYSERVKGHDYYFCSERCAAKFRDNPEKYAAVHPEEHQDTPCACPKCAMDPEPDIPALSPAAPEKIAASYTCPMHPEVHQPAPGTCPKCGMALEKEIPTSFTSAHVAAHAPAPDAKEETAVSYTCPMHPEVRQPVPGVCPKCGMALEPETVSAQDDENAELHDMTRRFTVAAAFSIPLAILVMGSHLPGLGLAWFAHAPYNPWVQFLLASPVVLWCGWPFFERFYLSLKNASLNMFTLIGLGVGVAYVYSILATIAPGLLAGAPGGMVDVYFEPAAVITTLVLLGQVLELKARSQTSGAIRALLRLTPDTARKVETDGRERDIPLAHVHKGDVLRVRPGE